MTTVTALQTAANGGWLTTDAIIAAVKPLTTASNLRAISSLLAPYAKSHQWRPQAGAFADFNALLAASSARFQGSVCQNNADDKVASFIDTLTGMNRIIDGEGPVVAYGVAAKDNSYEHIAEKFVKDHLVRRRQEGKTWASSRFQNGILFSTAIDRSSYAALLDKEVGLLNKLGIFHMVEAYLERVKSWNPTNAIVDSICYVSKLRILAKTYSPASPSGKQESGHLMYAIQPDAAKDGHFLLYHYEEILNDPQIPGVGWEAIAVDSVLAKVDAPRYLDQVRDAWPVVYFRER